MRSLAELNIPYYPLLRRDIDCIIALDASADSQDLWFTKAEGELLAVTTMAEFNVAQNMQLERALQRGQKVLVGQSNYRRLKPEAVMLSRNEPRGQRTMTIRQSGVWQKLRKAKWRNKHVGSAVFKPKAKEYQSVRLTLRPMWNRRHLMRSHRSELDVQ